MELVTETKIDDARARLEIALEKLLIGFENDTGAKIEEVSVDTRNFARLNVEVFIKTNP